MLTVLPLGKGEMEGMENKDDFYYPLLSSPC